MSGKGRTMNSIRTESRTNLWIFIAYNIKRWTY